MRSGLFQKAIYGLALAAAVLAGDSVRLVADTKPVSAREDVDRLPGDAARLYAEATLIPRPKKYEEIPWLLDLRAGFAQEKK
jgi:hypothetical protein